MNPSHRNLPLLLLHAREAAMSHFRPILKHFGLTDQQWRILRALSEADDELEPGQIAEECKIQKPSLTGILARMVDLKWIDRHASTSDQRRQLISLTAKGRALVDRMAPFVDRQYQLIEDSVGIDALNAIYRSLDARVRAAQPGNRLGDDRRRAAPDRSRVRLPQAGASAATRRKA